MLNQRSEIEQFFLEALEQIKDEIRKKIALERKQKRSEFGGIMKGMGGPSQMQSSQQENGAGGPAAGSLGSSMMAGSAENSKLGGTNKNYQEKVDLNDLDWEDRERVLRLLFSKMNAGVPTNAARVQLQKMQSDRGHSAPGQQQDYSALPAINYEGY